MKLYKLKIGDHITINEPYLKFLLKDVKIIRHNKFNLLKPYTWFKKRYFVIVIEDLK